MEADKVADTMEAGVTDKGGGEWGLEERVQMVEDPGGVRRQRL